MKNYSNGKKWHASKYGIDWDACCKKLMDTLHVDSNERKYDVHHIIALYYFDLTDPAQVRRAFSPENLEWLPASENRSRGKKWVII